MRAAVEAQIEFFGQTPTRLLSRPHARRRPRPAVGMSCQMFSRPEAVNARHFWIGGRPSSSWLGLPRKATTGASTAELDPVVFISAVPLEDKLLTVTRSGRLFVHRWLPLKPNGSSMPFTFEPASVPLTTLPATTPVAHATCYAVSGDGRWLLSGGHGCCSLRCTSLTKPDLVVHAQQHCAAITCIDVGADDVTVLTGSEDGTLTVWALYGERGQSSTMHVTPRVLHVLSAHKGDVCCAALSTQLDLVISGASCDRCNTSESGAASAVDAATRLGHDRCALWTAAKGRFLRWLPITSTPSAVAIRCSLSPDIRGGESHT